jgi:hypothetical protein
LDTGVFSYISENIDKYKKMADAELNCLTATSASQSLKAFVGVQSTLFDESLTTDSIM